MNNLVLREGKDKVYININHSFAFKPNVYESKFFVAVKKEDGDFEPCFISASCRSYMGEGLFQLKAGSSFPKGHRFNNPNNSVNYQFSPAFNYLDGSTFIGLEVGIDDKIKMFKSRFSDLNAIEKEFDIPLSIYTILDNKPYTIMVEGSPLWKDSCWKIQLYTYMLKSLLTDKENPSESIYMELVKKYRKELFSNVHMAPDEEVFDPDTYGTDTFNRHVLTGFVSICEGRNIPMTKALGINCKAIIREDF